MAHTSQDRNFLRDVAYPTMRKWSQDCCKTHVNIQLILLSKHFNSQDCENDTVANAGAQANQGHFQFDSAIFEGCYLSTQICSWVLTPTTIHKDVKDNKLAEPDRNTNRLIPAFLDKTSPVISTGETKSAKGPTTIREMVLEIDRILTWCAAGEPSINCPENHPVNDGGRAITIVPIFDITISDYVKTF